MVHNYLKEFERGTFLLEEKFFFFFFFVFLFFFFCFFKEKFRDAHTDARKGQTHDGHNTRTIARWPPASGAKNGGKGRKHCGKRKNLSLRVISPFPTVFSRLQLQTCKSKGLFWENVKRAFDIFDLQLKQWQEPWFPSDLDRNVCSLSLWNWQVWQEYRRMGQRPTSYTHAYNISFRFRHMGLQILLKIILKTGFKAAQN